MFKAEPIIGRILAVHGTTPGPASGITYTIEWWAEGIGVMSASGLAPSIPRWPDTVKVDAYPVGAFVHGAMFAQNLFWLFAEIPATRTCEELNGSGLRPLNLPTGGSGLGAAPPPVGGGSETIGPSTGPIPGGGGFE